MPYGYGSANTGSSSSGSSHDRGGGQHRATATRQVAASRARDRHPTTESTGREQAIANRTYGRPDTVTYGGPNVHGEGLGSQTFNKNLRTIQRRHDYNQLANQRAHPFLSKLGGIGGLLKGIGKAGLSFFGGIPGKALSGIMTASDYAKRKGTGAWEGLQDFGEGIQEFGEHDNLMSYLNRNKVQAIKPIESMPTNQEIIGERIGEYWRQPQNNNLGVDNQFIEEEQNLYPNVGLGAAEGGRIGYNRGRVVNPGGYQGDIEIPEGFLEGLPNEDYHKMIEELMKQKKQEELMRELGPFQWAAEGGIARLL